MEASVSLWALQLQGVVPVDAACLLWAASPLVEVVEQKLQDEEVVGHEVVGVFSLHSLFLVNM